MKNEFPSSWSMYKFQEMAEVVTGTTPSTMHPEYYGGSIPFVGPTELGYSEPIIQSSKWLSDKGARQARLLPAESVLVCCIGATIGKIGFSGTKLATNQQINALVCDQKVACPRYVFHYCRTLEKLIRQQGSSTTLPLLPKGRFQKLEIPLPPLEEQRRIAAILDKADGVRRKRKEAIRLTEELLRSTFLDMFGDPVTNPKGWEIKCLEDFAEIQSGIAKGKKINPSEAISVPYMRVANVQDGYVDLTEIKELQVRKIDIGKYSLKKGDVLLTEGGDPDKLGRGAVWQGQIQSCIHQNHIFCVRPNSLFAESEYLSAIIGSEYGKRYFLRAAKQTTGIATINKTQLQNFPALVPPISLQKQYVQVVEQIRVTRQHIENDTEQTENLFNSLLQRAFRGEL